MIVQQYMEIELAFSHDRGVCTCFVQLLRATASSDNLDYRAVQKNKICSNN